MPSTGLPIGPYALSSQNLDLALTRTGPGAYALGRLQTNGSFVVSYVGRSDADLKARLKSHAENGAYSVFKAGYAPSAKAAFEWECQMVHDFPGLDNAVHPARPAGSNWKCPRCRTFG